VTHLAALLLPALLLLAPPPVHAAPVPDPAAGAAVSSEAGAHGVLHAWDERRSAAWARGDVAGLRQLYVAGSRTGRVDVAMLRAYAARGLRVTGLRSQLLAVEVRSRTPARLSLRVTDRLVGGVVRGAGGPLALPRDLPTTHAVTMLHRRGGWRIASVR
jgi:hypothetical protein